MRGFFLIVKAELVRSFIIMRRYWFATIIGLAMGYGTLVGMVAALMFAAESEMVTNMANKAVSGILGFLIGIFAFGIVGLFTQGIQGMARTGQLEQVCLSPFGLVTNFFARSFVAAVNSILSSTLMIVLVAKTVASDNLHLAPLETIVLLALTYVNLIGFGFMVGGLVLIFKQTGQVAMIIRFTMLGLAIFAEKVVEMNRAVRWLAHMLPITDAAICLKYTLIQGQQRFRLDEAGEKIVKEIIPVLDPSGNPVVGDNGEQVVNTVYEMVHQSVFVQESFFFLLVSCVLWTLIGIACFRFMENWSRDRGTLGAY